MASYAEHVSDNLQHASELLEIDRKLSQDKFLQQENILVAKQKEIEEIIIANKRNEINNLSVSTNREHDNEYDNYHNNNVNINNDDDYNNDEIHTSQNIKNLRNSTSSQKNLTKSSQNIPQKSNPNKLSSLGRQSESEIKVEKEVELYGGSEVSEDVDDYDDYSIAFDLDNSRMSQNDRFDGKKTGGGGGGGGIDTDRERTDKPFRRTSFNASISSEGLPSFLQNQTNVSASTSQKKKNLGSSFQREIPADSDYSEIFESVEYENENEKEVDEVEESMYRSVDSTYSNLKNGNNNSTSQSVSFDDNLRDKKTEKSKMKNISTSFNKDQNKPQNKPNLKATVGSSVNNSSVTYSTDSYNSTDDPNLSISYGGNSIDKKKKTKEGKEKLNSSGNVISSPNWSRNIPQARSLSPQEADFLLRNRRQHGSPGRFQAGPRSPTRDRRVAGYVKYKYSFIFILF